MKRNRALPPAIAACLRLAVTTAVAATIPPAYWAACAAEAPAVRAAAPAGALTLKDAVLFALEHSPAFDSARKTQGVRELQYRSAFAKLLPSLDFATTDGLQNNIPIASTDASVLLASNPTAPWYSSLSLGLTETLYDNGVTLTGLEVARLNRELADVALRKQRDSLALDVATEFYHYSLVTELLVVRKQQLEILQRQFRTLSGQYQQGFKTRIDFLRIKTQVQRAEIDRVTAENDIRQSEANLARILGSPAAGYLPVPVDRARKTAELPTTPPRLDAFYDAVSARIQRDVNEQSVSLARRNYWPQVSLSGGVNYINQSYINAATPFSAGNQLSWDALVTVQYNLWDWGTRRRDVEVAELNRDIQDDSLELGLLGVGAQISGLMADIGRIGSNYELARDLLALEEESNRDLEAQYREGKVTYLDLVTELTNLLDAKVQFYTSYFDVLTAAARYRYYQGGLYEWLVEK